MGQATCIEVIGTSQIIHIRLLPVCILIFAREEAATEHPGRHREGASIVLQHIDVLLLVELHLLFQRAQRRI